MKPHTIHELGEWLNSSQTSRHPIHGFSVDSRSIKAGEVYFALPGVKMDGHHFLKEVAEKRACGAVVQKNYVGENYGLPLIYVEDVLNALQEVAKKTLANYKSKVVGVTGSVGKTTTKDFITTLLKEKYVVSSSPGNSNSQVGIPLAILNHTSGQEDIIILEMSMTHKGNIKRLVDIAPPDVALVTLVSLVHAVNFQNIEGIAEAKAEIFSHPKTQMGFLSFENEQKEILLSTGSCKKQTFSLTNSKADFYSQIKENKMIIKTPQSEEITLPLPNLMGEHNLYNLLAAVAVSCYLDLDWSHIQNGIEKLRLPERRLQQSEKMGVLFINDAYNASLLSVKAALKSLPLPKTGKKRIAVLGEMLELGSFSEQCHKEIGEFALQYVDHMICLGKGCKPIKESWENVNKPIQWKSSREEVLYELKKITQPGDVVLLKGSRAFELWKVLEEF